MIKRLFIILISVGSTGLLSAQTYAGIKGHMANTWLLNQHVADAGDHLDYKGSYAGGFGIQALHMLGESAGLGLNLGASTIKQQTQGSIGDVDYINEVKLKYTDIGLFYTHMGAGGFFFEVGPQFSFRTDEVEEVYDLDGNNEENRTVMDPNLNSSTIFGVMGLGGMINVNEQIKVNLGLHFAYGINDLTNELSSAELADLVSEDTSVYTDISQGEDYNDETMEVTYDYKATHPAFASFNVGIYYQLK